MVVGRSIPSQANPTVAQKLEKVDTLLTFWQRILTYKRRQKQKNVGSVGAILEYKIEKWFTELKIDTFLV